MIFERSLPILVGAFLATALIFIPSCGRKQQHMAQQPKKLANLWDGSETQVVQNNVVLKAKKFTAEDFDTIFDGRGKGMLKGKKGIQPVQISIQNNGTLPLLLTQKSLDMELVKNKDVEWYFKKNRGLFVFAMLGVLAACYAGAWGFLYFFWMGKSGSIVGGLLGFGLLIGTYGGFFLGTPIVGIYQFKKDAAQNTQAVKNVNSKIIKDSILVEPGQTIDVLAFVKKKNFKEQFTVTLLDAADEQRSVQLDVDLGESK